MNKAEETDDPIKKAKERYKTALDSWSEDRKRYVEDVKFVEGDHWPEQMRKQREQKNRPCLTIDKLKQYVRQVVNDSRQNRPSIKVRPVDSDADVETAEIYQGLTRHIEDRSNADIAYDTAIECATKGGFGFIRVLTEYAHEGTFDQEIVIKRVRNPLTVVFDPNCQEADGSDARFCFVSEDLTEEEFEAQYPKAEKIDWQSEDDSDWCWEKKVKVAEYWYIEKEPRTMHLLADGSTVSDDEVKQAQAEGIQVPDIVKSREIPVKTLYWARLNGQEFLEGPEKRPGKYIQIVPVWGNEVDVDGEIIHTSMIHASKDAQLLYDFSRTAFAERVALTPKAPWVAPVGAVENFENEWATANTESHSVLKYNHVDESGNVIPAPSRAQASDIPAGFAQDMQMSEHDIQSTLGMYNASLGQASNEKSGRAILARQKEGDITNFHYHDNLARAIRHVGRIVVDLIPSVYDSTRVVRILGVDGTAEMVKLDPTMPQASGKNQTGEKVFNLGVGTYDVSVSVGPSYTTRRAESAEAMVQLTQANPQLMGVIGDLMIRSMDWPNSDEIADRLKLMLPPQIQQAEQKDGEQSPEVMAVIQQAEQAQAQADQVMAVAAQQIEELKAQVEQLTSEKEVKDAELAIKGRETEIKAYDAETKRAQVLAPAFDAQQIQALVIQTMQDLMNQPIEAIPQPEQYSMAMGMPTDDAPEMMGGIQPEPMPQGY